MSTCVVRADACASDNPLAATAVAVATKPRRERSGDRLAVGSTATDLASVVTCGLLAGFLKRVPKASLYATDRTEGDRDGRRQDGGIHRARHHGRPHGDQPA